MLVAIDVVIVFILVSLIGMLMSGTLSLMFSLMFGEVRPFVTATVESIRNNPEEWRVGFSSSKVTHVSGICVWISTVGWSFCHFHSPYMDTSDHSNKEQYVLYKAGKALIALKQKQFADSSSVEANKLYDDIIKKLRGKTVMPHKLRWRCASLVSWRV